MKFRTASLFLGLLMVVGMNRAQALEVGDAAPAVMLEGVAPGGTAIVSSVNTVLKDGQSYTLLEFFETENADSKANLGTISEQATDMSEFVATRLIATNTEDIDVLTFIQNNQSDIVFPVHFDTKQDAMRAYGVTQIPTTFVIRDENKIIFKHEGVLTDDVVEQLRASVGY